MTNVVKEFYVAVDFDDTLRDSRTGEPVEGSLRGMQELERMGARVIVWTCQPPVAYENVRSWMAMHGIWNDSMRINTGVSLGDDDFGFSPKIVAEAYFDDRGAGWPGWRKAIQWLKNRRCA